MPDSLDFDACEIDADSEVESAVEAITPTISRQNNPKQLKSPTPPK
ncbi:MAG: hypothetical protein ABR577_12050 [Pyrinomonadaceae bacterium]